MYSIVGPVFVQFSRKIRTTAGNHNVVEVGVRVGGTNSGQFLLFRICQLDGRD